MEIAQHSPLFRGREYTDEEMWGNYEYFIKAVLPEAEAAGVRLALHPDDPPLEKLGGIPRLFHDFDGFKRGMDIANNSRASGLNFCLGNWTAMGTDILAAIPSFWRTRTDRLRTRSRRSRNSAEIPRMLFR